VAAISWQTPHSLSNVAEFFRRRVREDPATSIVRHLALPLRLLLAMARHCEQCGAARVSVEHSGQHEGFASVEDEGLPAVAAECTIVSPI